MTADEIDFGEEGGGIRRWGVRLLLLLLALALALWVYRQATAVQGVKVEAPPPSVVDMLPPPPPPPPPPPEPQVKPPEPTDAPTPAPSPEPKTPDAPAPVTINGPAQAGTDAFGMQSGSGSGAGAPGGTGTCLGAKCGTGGTGEGGVSEGFYRRYLSTTLQQRVQDDDKLNRLVFSADFAITIGPDGRLGAVSLERSSGKDDRDQELMSVLRSVGSFDPPPASLRFPQRITVRGRRSL